MYINKYVCFCKLIILPQFFSWDYYNKTSSKLEDCGEFTEDKTNLMLRRKKTERWTELPDFLSQSSVPFQKHSNLWFKKS